MVLLAVLMVLTRAFSRASARATTATTGLQTSRIHRTSIIWRLEQHRCARAARPCARRIGVACRRRRIEGRVDTANTAVLIQPIRSRAAALTRNLNNLGNAAGEGSAPQSDQIRNGHHAASGRVLCLCDCLFHDDHRSCPGGQSPQRPRAFLDAARPYKRNTGQRQGRCQHQAPRSVRTCIPAQHFLRAGRGEYVCLYANDAFRSL